jgi:hypothetical protein
VCQFILDRMRGESALAVYHPGKRHYLNLDWLS